VVTVGRVRVSVVVVVISLVTALETVVLPYSTEVLYVPMAIVVEEGS
jgi:hypothetical protein